MPYGYGAPYGGGLYGYGWGPGYGGDYAYPGGGWNPMYGYGPAPWRAGGGYPGRYRGPGRVGWGYGWPYTTNPDANWWYMYGAQQGIPPYNRFLERFFPGSTGGAGWGPTSWPAGPPPPPPPPGARSGGSVAVPQGHCALIAFETTDEQDATITVRLPNLGASTPRDLQLTIERQLSRGFPVVLRDASGYVVRLPPASALTRLDVKSCGG